MCRLFFLPVVMTALLGIVSVSRGQEPTKSAVLPLKLDIEFAKVGDVSLTLDAFVPDGPGPFPTCILVHGGGFVRGDKQTYIKPLFAPLSEAGFTWFTINYRLAPEHRWPACADDALGPRARQGVQSGCQPDRADW